MDDDLLNYWNLKQVIYLRGKLAPDFFPLDYFKLLYEQELIQEYSEELFEQLDLSLIH